jgi:hypothetical protein
VAVEGVQVSQLGEYDLLIVGAPTHKVRPSDAVVEMLENVSKGSLRGTSVAAFDTRLTPDAFPSRLLARLAGLVGYAAPKIAKHLKNAGGGTWVRPRASSSPEGKGRSRRVRLSVLSTG